MLLALLSHPQLASALLQWLVTDASLLLSLRRVSRQVKRVTDAFIVDAAVEYVLVNDYNYQWEELNGTFRILWMTSQPQLAASTSFHRVYDVLSSSNSPCQWFIDSLPDNQKKELAQQWCRLGTTRSEVSGQRSQEMACYTNAIRLDADCSEAWLGFSHVCPPGDTIMVPGVHEPVKHLDLVFKALKLNPKCQAAWAKLACGLRNEVYRDDEVTLFGPHTEWVAEACCAYRLLSLPGFEEVWKPLARERGWNAELDPVGRNQFESIMTNEQIFAFLTRCLSQGCLDQYTILSTMNHFGFQMYCEDTRLAFHSLVRLAERSTDRNLLPLAWELLDYLASRVEDSSACEDEYDAYMDIEAVFLSCDSHPALVKALRDGVSHSFYFIEHLLRKYSSSLRASFQHGYLAMVLPQVSPDSKPAVLERLLPVIAAVYDVAHREDVDVVTALEEDGQMANRLLNVLEYLTLDWKEKEEANDSVMEGLCEAVIAYLEYLNQQSPAFDGTASLQVVLRERPRAAEALSSLSRYTFTVAALQERLVDLMENRVGSRKEVKQPEIDGWGT